MGKNKTNKDVGKADINNTQKLEDTKRISKGFEKNNPTKSK